MKIETVLNIKNKKTNPRDPGLKLAAIGIFDGVHIGHRKILKALLNRARKTGGESIVVTFDPHPDKVIRPHKPVRMLSSLEHRMKVMFEMGIDRIFVIKFDRSFSKQRPEVFMSGFFKRDLNIKELFIGSDFVLGRDREGCTDILTEIGKRLGIKVNVIKNAVLDGKVVSSTLIRNSVLKGDLHKAEKLLGRKYSLLGTVVHGRKRGRKLGFPTANIDPHHEAVPPSGVYAVKAFIEGRPYCGVMNIGFRPTFEKQAEPTVEIHILGFRKNIYGKHIEAVLLKKIREERHFKSTEHLLQGIRLDLKKIARFCR